MARFCSSSSLGTRTSARAERLPSTKRSSFKQSALASSPSVFTRRFCSSNFCGHTTWQLIPSAMSLALQSKTKPARFIDRVDLCPAAVLKLGCPAQKCCLLEPLRRLRVAASLLGDHDVKLLVHIDSKLDYRLARIKLQAGSLV